MELQSLLSKPAVSHPFLSAGGISNATAARRFLCVRKGIAVASLAHSPVQTLPLLFEEAESQADYFQEYKEAPLIDVEETSDGYTLFKFGDTVGSPFNDPADLLSVTDSTRRCSSVFLLPEVIDCSTIESRILDVKEDSFSVEDFGNSHSVTKSSSRIRNNDCTSSSHKLDHETFFHSFDANAINFFHQAHPGLSNYASIKAPDGFSFGVRGSGTITIMDDEFDYFLSHDASFSCEDSFALDSLLSLPVNRTMVKLLPSDLNSVDTGRHKSGAPVTKLRRTTSVVERTQRSRKNAGSRHKRPAKTVTRDLYKSSSFQLYEVIFTYPFSSAGKDASVFQNISKEKFGEIFNVLNQIAVGLAGSGLALVLFVASRMLSMNATLDSIKVMHLVRGIGLLWFASALQKFGSVIKCMANVCSQVRPERKKHLARFRKEAQAVTFKAVALVLVSMVSFA